MDGLKKGNGNNKNIANFRETIPLIFQNSTGTILYCKGLKRVFTSGFRESMCGQSTR
jgi:hypothetical protein